MPENFYTNNRASDAAVRHASVRVNTPSKPLRSISTPSRIADFLIFAGFIVVAAGALAALLLATPIMMIISAAAGIFAGKSDRGHWRSVEA